MEEICPNCKRKHIDKKILICKFCEKYFCSLTCLIQHSSLHSETTAPNALITTLKKRQSKDITNQYRFITQGVFTDDYEYDEKYDIKNFSKIYEGIIPIELGAGAFGRVYLVRDNLSEKPYALKVINKHKLLQTYGNCKLIHNEIDIHSKLNHPNIIRLYNVSETDEEINILLEYAKNGSLFSLIHKEKGFSEHKAYKYFIQIVNAVYFLHQNNIIHRDIKPENILIGENDLLKLCDFGCAKELTMNKRSTFCGTVEYMAPEIVGSENYDYSVDIWSLGILLFELLMGYSPFRSKKEKNIMIKIKNHIDLKFDKNKKLSKDCKDLINKLLDMNPLNRLKIKDIFVHPFIITNSALDFKIGSSNRNIKRKESLDDSNENILKYYNSKNANFKEDFTKLRKKFGFESTLNLRDQVSSKNLCFGNFQSDKNIISVKTFDSKKIEKKESQRLEKLIGNMSNELEKGKKKVDDLNFQNSKQFSFEDFRDNKILYDDNKKKGNIRNNWNNIINNKNTINLNNSNSQEDSKLKDTMYSSHLLDDEEEKKNNIAELPIEEDFSN